MEVRQQVSRFRNFTLGFAVLAISLVALSVSKLPEIFLSPTGGAIASAIALSSSAAIVLALLLGNEASE